MTDSTIHGHQHHAGHDHKGHDHKGHDHKGHDHSSHVAQYRRLFWIMLFVALPVVGFNSMFAMIVGYSLPETNWVHWISPVLGTVMYIWGGKPFLTGAVDEIRAKQPGMMLLVALAITVAFISSWGSTLGIFPHDLNFWWELALLVVIMLLGHWIEMKSLAQTTSALDSLAALLPDTAERITQSDDGEQIEKVAPADLLVGDTVLVRPGSAVPSDGTIVDGTASMDESMITGESRTVRKSSGEKVIAGTVATDSGIRITVTAIGDETEIAGIRKLVTAAQASSSRAQRIADIAAGWLFWFALTAAIITAIVWTVIGQPDDAIVRAITVLVIACPHALGLAIPLVVSIATERAAVGGVLIKDRLALESMRTVTSVLFDKTGTLTVGEPTVTGINTEKATFRDPQGTVLEDDTLLAFAAAAESSSEHPLAKAIIKAAADNGVSLPSSTEFSSSPAVGVRARVSDDTSSESHIVEVGGPYLLKQHGLAELPINELWREEGAIILHVLIDGQVAGALRLADDIRPESRETVDALHARGIDVVMITGDAAAVAHTVAKELGIDRIFSGVRPEDKASKVQELQQEGQTVAMVGDGVNDAPALAQADVGIAIGAGTDVAIASAGVVLASSDPRSVLSVIELSNASYTKMRQNLWWAAGYNILSVPLAAGILAPIGFILPMSVGALLMSVSTIVVALNAQLLRRLDLRPENTV